MPNSAAPLTADALDLLRRRVLNVVGHELRGPAVVVQALAQELAAADDDTVRNELAAALVRTADRLAASIDDLLLAAGVTTLLPTEPRGPVAVQQLVRAEWNALAPPEALELTGSAVALSRPSALKRIFHEVLENAHEYGVPPARAHIRTDDPRLVVDVVTKGDVPAGDLELACEPFLRGEAAVMARRGIGIGLAVARTLARHEGGDVRLSTSESGVVAVVELEAA